MVEHADRPSPIMLSPALVNRVDTEVRASEFEDFRKEELLYMRERNHALYQLHGAMYEMAITKYGEEEARQVVTGFLFAHRILRYGNNNMPLPHRSIEQADAILQQTAQDNPPPGEKSLEEKMFEEHYKGHRYLVDRVNTFRFITTQFGARQLFNLYGDAVGEGASEDNKSSLGDIIKRVYTEVKASDFDEFCTIELTGLKKANSPLHQQAVEEAANFMGKYDEEEAKKFALGVSVAHRILRYARGGLPLPAKPMDECKAVIKNAVAMSKTTDLKQSLLETAFKERFEKSPELIDFVYDDLTQPMTRYGVEFLLLIHAEELDPQATTQ